MFFSLLSQRHLSFVGVLLLALASAALGIGILAFIRAYFLVASAPVDLSVLMTFFALVLGLMLLSAVSQISLHRLGHRFVMDLRQTWVASLLKLDLQQIQNIGSGRVLALLNTDIRNITMAFVHLPELVHSLLLSMGILLYLALLSPQLFGLIIAAIVIVGLLGLSLVGKLNHFITLLRRDEDRLQQDYQAMISGKRELTLNRARAEAFFQQELTEHADSYRDNVTRADSLVDISNSLSNAVVLALVGLVFYMSIAQGWVSTDVAAIFALAILFLRTPLMSAVAAIPVMVTAQVSYRNMQSLDLPEVKALTQDYQASPLAGFQKLVLSQVRYGYQDAESGAQSFAVGPIDFQLQRGELVFIIGGNGSGKSTFANLLCGLYQPQQGGILIDGQRLQPGQNDQYRQLFSAIFSDFHVFSQLIDGQGNDVDVSLVEDWLQRLKMDHKVSVDNQRLSAVDFSQGQKKRLALLLAVIENRDCLLLDEWAADQDPQFRHFFYTELLPLLAKQGKTIVAITHDDHYFDGADRILKMDEGQLLELSDDERRALNRVVHPLDELTFA